MLPKLIGRGPEVGLSDPERVRHPVDGDISMDGSTSCMFYQIPFRVQVDARPPATLLDEEVTPLELARRRTTAAGSP
jgi:hypothetical protein